MNLMNLKPSLQIKKITLQRPNVKLNLFKKKTKIYITAYI